MSLHSPVVSVIMPCFNQGRYLDEAIASVLAQTLTSVEIIVIDDGSTEETTVRLLENYQRPHTTVLRTANRGPSAARNAGIQQAKGQYIFPLDADDRIAPTYLEQAVSVLEADPNIGIVYSKAASFGAATEDYNLPPYQFPQILLGNMIFNSSLYRKADWEKVGGYNENMVWGWEDYDFWLSLIELGRDVVQLPEVLYFHRELPNSRSQQMTQDGWVKSYTQIYQNHPRLYADHIETLFQELIALRSNLHETHSELHATRSDAIAAHAQLTQARDRIAKLEQFQTQAQAILGAMQSSKFWQLRNQWSKLQQRLGWKVESDELVPYTPLDLGTLKPTHAVAVQTIRPLPARLRTKAQKGIRVWRERGTVGLLRYVAERRQARSRQYSNYQQWIEQHEPTSADHRRAQAAIAQWTHQPTFSVLLPVYNVEAKWLEKAIESVRAQTYPHWELCIADDASPKAHIKAILDRYSQQDSRIKVILRSQNGNIAAASNSALELATGDYIALLDHDDELAPHALYENAKLINQHPDADFIYSDEDKIDAQGQRSDPFFKPDWSPDYFHSCMYTCHLGVYRTELVRQIGGFRSGYDGSQDYDLVLRLVEHTQQIYHLPKVLYHWRIIPTSVTSGEEAKPWAYDAAKRALADMVERSPYPGKVEPGPRAGFHRIRRNIIGNPLISIVIPSAAAMLDTPNGPICLLEQCIRSIRERSTYRHYEIVLVDGYDVPDPILAAIAGPDLRLIRCADPFNFAQRINLGAKAAQGEMLLLLNDDVEVITPDWLESMLEFAQQQEVGAVGAKLFFADGTIQHIGVMVLGGNPGHAYRGIAGDHPGYYLSNLVNRNYLAITAACLMMRRELYFDIGAMDETFPLNYNDVDLSLKLHQAGYRNVVTPYAQLTHYESISRGAGLKPREWEHLNTKWKTYFEQLGYEDPYYNPNLSKQEVLFEL